MRGLRLSAVALAVAVVPLAAAPALAAADPVTGYWTKLRSGGLPLPVQPPTPVPEGGSWVSADPTGPVAVSALRASADAGNVIVGLRLPVGSATGPTAVLVCPTTDTWVPEQGGRLEAAPPADCTTPVETKVEEDLLVVDLPATLQGEDIDLKLVPEDGSAFSLTLERATAEALVQQPAAGSAPPPALTPPPFDSGPSDEGFSSAPQSFGDVFAPAPGVAGPAPAIDPLLPGPSLPQPAATPVPQPQTAAAPVQLVRAPPLVPENRSTALAAAALLAMLGALALRLGLQPAQAPRRLGGVARMAPAEATPALPTPARGVGRFRAVRSRPPVQI